MWDGRAWCACDRCSLLQQVCPLLLLSLCSHRNVANTGSSLCMLLGPCVLSHSWLWLRPGCKSFLMPQVPKYSWSAYQEPLPGCSLPKLCSDEPTISCTLGVRRNCCYYWDEGSRWMLRDRVDQRWTGPWGATGSILGWGSCFREVPKM